MAVSEPGTLAAMIRAAVKLGGVAAAGFAAVHFGVADVARCDGTPSHLARWMDMWSKGRTHFHKAEVHPMLEK